MEHETESAVMQGSANVWGQRAGAVILGALATGTAVCIAILAGWERGAWLPERLLWIALGIVLTVSAHLIPALCRNASRGVLMAAIPLWIGCTIAVCHGHATFFLLAQQHAGTARAQAVRAVQGQGSLPQLLPLAPAIKTRGEWMAAIARLDAKACIRNCDALKAKRASLVAKLDVVDAEIVDIQQAIAVSTAALAERGRAEDMRQAMRPDPVTNLVATALQVPDAQVNLVTALLFAAVLEGVACLSWLLATWSCAIHADRRVTAVAERKTDGSVHRHGTSIDASHPVTVRSKALRGGSEIERHADLAPAATVVASKSAVVVPGRELESAQQEPLPQGETVTTRSGLGQTCDPVTAVLADGASAEFDPVAHLVHGLAQGCLRGTVAEIRRYLGCSQARALRLRRQLVSDGVLV